MSGQRSVILGLFFLVALLVLGYYTLFLTDFTLFKKQAELRVHFAETNGLREGDSVLVAGMRWGRVKKLVYDPDAPQERRILLIAALNEPLVLREGFQIRIEDATLLGGRNVSIEPGPAAGAKVDTERVLFGEVAPSPIDVITKLVEGSGQGIQQVVDDFAAITGGVRQGKGVVGRLLADEKLADDIATSAASLSRALAHFEAVAADLQKGRGTAGRLLSDEALYEELAAAARKLTTAIDEATLLARDVRAGNGIAGRLVSDETLAGDLSAAIKSARNVTEKIDRGEGTIGVLVNDDTIARDVGDIVGRVSRGEGTIGALLVRPEVYDNLREITEDIAVVTSALRSGQGSFGRLVMDDELYQQLRTALQTVQRSLEEFREAAPITTFTSVFFGAL